MGTALFERGKIVALANLLLLLLLLLELVDQDKSCEIMEYKEIK